MTRRTCPFAGTVFGFAILVTAVSAAAGEVQLTTNASYETRLNALEAELAEFRAQATHMSPAVPCDAACDCGVPCDSQDRCCGNSCSSQGGGMSGPGLIAGVGFYHIRPYWTNNPAISIGPSAVAIANAKAEQIDFNYSLAMAPRLWLGFRGAGGLGMRADYWTFNQADEVSVPALLPASIFQTASPLGLAGTGNVASTFRSGLELHVVGLEGMKGFTGRLRSSWWTAVVTGGVRYVHLEQSYRGAVNATGLTFVSSNQLFDGIGPTASAELRHGIGATGLSVYGQSRGSLLFGTSHQTATSFFAQGEQPVRNADHHTLLPIAELEVGTSYTSITPLGRLFFNFAFVGQGWFGAGNSSNSDLIVFTRPTAGTRGFQETADNNSNLGFLGWTFSTGLTY